jgi:hypothetical protein
MKIRIGTLAIGLAMVALPSVGAGVSWGQDPNLTPIAGSLTLSSGFQPDPRVIAVRAGGTIDASNISAECRGFISNAPDVRLNYTAGPMLPLIISVASAADTTLVVSGADGSWYCDDDGGTFDSNPMVRLNNPQSGRYEIWVGTYRAGRTETARLHISEVGSQ